MNTPIAATSIPRVVDPASIDPEEGGTFPNTNMPFAAGYPYLNKIFGDAAYEMKLVSLNARHSRQRRRRVLHARSPGATNTRPRSRTTVSRAAWLSPIPTPEK